MSDEKENIPILLHPFRFALVSVENVQTYNNFVAQQIRFEFKTVSAICMCEVRVRKI